MAIPKETGTKVNSVLVEALETSTAQVWVFKSQVGCQ